MQQRTASRPMREPDTGRAWTGTPRM